KHNLGVLFLGSCNTPELPLPIYNSVLPCHLTQVCKNNPIPYAGIVNGKIHRGQRVDDDRFGSTGNTSIAGSYRKLNFIRTGLGKWHLRVSGIEGSAVDHPHTVYDFVTIGNNGRICEAT